MKLRFPVPSWQVLLVLGAAIVRGRTTLAFVPTVHHATTTSPSSTPVVNRRTTESLRFDASGVIANPAARRRYFFRGTLGMSMQGYSKLYPLEDHNSPLETGVQALYGPPAVVTSDNNSDSKVSKGNRLVNKNIENIFAQNAKWKESHLKDDPNYFSRLGSVHQPDYLWIGESGSRHYCCSCPVFQIAFLLATFDPTYSPIDLLFPFLQVQAARMPAFQRTRSWERMLERSSCKFHYVLTHGMAFNSCKLT